MRFIGDSHGKFDRYRAIALASAASIQVGDFGVGFGIVPDMPSAHRFIRGNHDDPNKVAQYNWIPDVTVEGDMFLMGGGESIDQYRRIEGRDWWRDEQLDMGALFAATDIYDVARPRVVVTHECPSDAALELFPRTTQRNLFPSRTSQALSSMLWIHRPEIWIFGHWHERVDRTIDGTRFICLEELGHIDL